MNSSSHLLLVLVIVLGLSSLKPSYGASNYALPFTKWSVTIINNMSEGTQLFLHCKSKDDDLKEQVVEVGGQFSWKFRENFWHTTLFWCAFAKKGNYHAAFKVFWPELDQELADRCDYSNCIWAVTDQGFLLKNIPEHTFEFQHPWELGNA